MDGQNGRGEQMCRAWIVVMHGVGIWADQFREQEDGGGRRCRRMKRAQVREDPTLLFSMAE